MIMMMLMNCRSGQYARTIEHVGIDHGVWTAMGIDCLSFVWTSWDARVVPCETNDADHGGFDFEEYRTVELCSEVAYEKTCELGMAQH